MEVDSIVFQFAADATPAAGPSSSRCRTVEETAQLRRVQYEAGYRRRVQYTVLVRGIEPAECAGVCSQIEARPHPFTLAGRLVNLAVLEVVEADVCPMPPVLDSYLSLCRANLGHRDVSLSTGPPPSCWSFCQPSPRLCPLPSALCSVSPLFGCAITC